MHATRTGGARTPAPVPPLLAWPGLPRACMWRTRPAVAVRAPQACSSSHPAVAAAACACGLSTGGLGAGEAGRRSSPLAFGSASPSLCGVSCARGRRAWTTNNGRRRGGRGVHQLPRPRATLHGVGTCVYVAAAWRSTRFRPVSIGSARAFAGWLGPPAARRRAAESVRR